MSFNIAFLTPPLKMAELSLLCTEDMCFEDNPFGISHDQKPFFDAKRSDFWMVFPLQSEERVREMIEKEIEHLPGADYLNRLRSGELDLSVRREALDWISKACAHLNFGPLSFCLSVNYLDRFLSLTKLTGGQTWSMQLLAVACLSIATKVAECEVPALVDFQVGEPKFMFESKSIERMELLLLRRLGWRMQAITPCSFIDYFLSKINGDQYPCTLSINQSVELILNTFKGIDQLEFRSSEIAAAVAISVSKELQAIDIDKAMACLLHVQKEKVLKCVELIKDLGLNLNIGGSAAKVGGGSAAAGGAGDGGVVPQSPSGVLDAACLSNKSDDITVGSCAKSSDSSPATKKSKLGC